jgi:hypothetical protein
MERHNRLWLFVGAAFVALGAALFGVSAAIVAAKPAADHAHWTTTWEADLAYCLVLAAVVCVIAAARGWRFPSARESPSHPVPAETEPSTEESENPAPATHLVEESRAESEKPNVIDVTPKYLVGLFRGQTSIQGQRLADIYLGKWMTVSGRLGDVDVFGSAGAQVVFQTGISDVVVYMWFEDEEYVDERIAVLKKGDRISVLGKIDRIRSIDVQLKECRLIDDDE